MNALPTKPCAYCGGQFPRDIRCTWAHWSRAKYCSRACTGAAKAAKAAALRPSKRAKFNAQVVQVGDCWEWTGARDRDGYGIFSYARKTYRAPVVALELDGRPVPAGMYACHHCDNPACVKPRHLYPGTPAQNMADAKARGRISHGKKAKLTPNDVRDIRLSAETDGTIAMRFGVSRSAVSMVRSRKTWRDVA